jgi:hypothetical protein
MGMKRLFLYLLLIAPLFGQSTPITSITTQTTTIGATSYGGATFNGLNRAVMTMADSSGNNYTIAGTSTDAFLRRNTGAGNSNNTSVTFASAGTPNTFLGPYATTTQTVLLGNNIYQSIDNVFANGTTVSTGNIERVDYLFNGSAGLVATSLDALAIFERGLVGQHDSFNVSLITGWDSLTNTPTSFTRITTVSTLNFGPSNVTVDGVANYTYGYNLFRYNTGDNLTNWTANNETSSQGIGGVILNWLGLGAKNGQTIYGYSIAANDTTTTRNRFDNYDNSNWFPTNSTNGFDPFGANGQVWRHYTPVPEPSTYGAIFVALMLGVIVWKRKR